MPGIVGYLGPNVSRQKAALSTMVKAMLHESFYKSGTYINEDLGVAVGWICHPDSYADGLPAWNEQKNIGLIFAGEHFADQADLTALRSAGHEFVDDRVSSLVHLYEESGDRFFTNLNGAFSGLLLDLRKREAVLFNDRHGLNRVYYHQTPDGLYFASEAKALLKVLPHLRAWDGRSVGEFLVCGAPLQNRTLFADLSILPGASRWTNTGGNGAIRKETYFDKATWENLPTLSPKQYEEKLEATFAQILPRYFAGRRRIALSLTGGLDSRMVIALAPATPFKLDCYTFGGLYHECADVAIARRVAAVSQQRHTVIPMNRKFFSEFPALAKRAVYFTDGALDVSGAAGLFVNRAARAFAPVRLTGNYGDEVLRWHVPFKASTRGSLIGGGVGPEWSESARIALDTYAAERNGNTASFVAFKQVPWHHHARWAMEQTQLTVRSPYLDKDLLAVTYQAPTEVRDSVALALRIINSGNPLLARIPTDRGFVGKPGSPGWVVREKYRRFTVKAEYAYDYGMPGWLARLDTKLAPLHLERLFLGRNKYSHFRLWYRHELAQFLRDMLLDSRTLSRPYLDRKAVERIVTEHTTGRGNHTLQIHTLLTLEYVQRLLIEKQ